MGISCVLMLQSGRSSHSVSGYIVEMFSLQRTPSIWRLQTKDDVQYLFASAVSGLSYADVVRAVTVVPGWLLAVALTFIPSVLLWR
jgi:hypothetical protein